MIVYPFSFIKTAGGGLDPDATTYLNAVVAAGGTVDSTISAAVNTLFVDLKTNGLYSKLKVLYPFIGGSSGSNAINAVDVGNFDIIWNNVGDLSFGISGVTTSSGSGYGDTQYNPNIESSPTDTSWGIYLTEGNFDGEVYSFGAYDGTSINNHRKDTSTIVGLYGYGLDRISLTSISDFNGSWISTINSGSTKTLTHNISNTSTSGTTSGAATGTVALVNEPYYLFVLNLFGSPYSGQYYYGTMMSFFSGDYLTSSEILTIDTIINAFQTSLGRNLY
jgi:hypothetical protein